MILNTNQVAEKLGVSGGVVRRMVRDGLLKPTNVRAEGAKSFHARFNSKDISEYIKANGTPRKSKIQTRVLPNSVIPISPLNVLSRMAEKLEQLSEKIDALYNMWK